MVKKVKEPNVWYK